ncbi:MAG: hypothetical protein KGD63_09540 [Candidatus Lokiarchaeota archaeon]|nr:hypothetical protein [Candidatus Lokiarchaeota archaeon]
MCNSLSYNIYLKNNQPIKKNWKLFSFPPYWFYDVLTVLQYFYYYNHYKDNRLQKAIDLVKKKQNKDGTWNVQKKHLGKTYFDMEIVGKPSKWNTLRVLRVLKWWDS